MRKPWFEAKLLAMQLEFWWATYWLDQIPKSKWTQANDEGKCYGHMTTNIVECMNSILKEAWALPITILVKQTFNKINDLFVTNGMKIMNMIKTRHRYSKEVYVTMQENRRIASTHYYQMYIWEAKEFEVQEITNTRLGWRAMARTVKLNNWRCDRGEF